MAVTDTAKLSRIGADFLLLRLTNREKFRIRSSARCHGRRPSDGPLAGGGRRRTRQRAAARRHRRCRGRLRWQHGTGHRAHVLIGYLPRALRITVSNPTASDGAGARHLGMNQGLIGMRERVDSVRGALRYGADGTGRWLLVADLPTEPAHDDLDSPDDLAAQGDTQ